MSWRGVLEYPEFYLRFIDGRFPVESVWPPMAQALHPGALNVTGEHGDQLFGSQLLAPYVRRGVAHEPYRDLLPLVMLERLRNPVDAWRVGRYLQPVLDAAPAPMVSLFDALWWLNFSLKWQDVSLRMVGLSGGLARVPVRRAAAFLSHRRVSALVDCHHARPAGARLDGLQNTRQGLYPGIFRRRAVFPPEDQGRLVAQCAGRERPGGAQPDLHAGGFSTGCDRRAAPGGGTPCAVVPGRATAARTGSFPSTGDKPCGTSRRRHRRCC